MIMIGSARIDERGRAAGGAVGDQKQTSTPDYTGEVSQQQFYFHKKGWYVLRPKSPVHANAIAANMITACDNKNIGYDQSGRLDIITRGVHTATPTSCDCSSLVRACVMEATGKDPGNFDTAAEVAALKKTGLFEGERTYIPGMTLYTGDVLVTKRKGHTAIVTSGAIRSVTVTANKSTGGEKSLEEVAKECWAGKWGNGAVRKAKLTAAGYDYAAVQAMINKLYGKKK